MECGDLRPVGFSFLADWAVACQLRRGVTIGSMGTYRVVLRQSEEGISVSCPGLPGCWSQGATEEEALANIRIAIREYIEAAEELTKDEESRVVEVAVA